MIACLSVPYFAAAVEHRDNEGLASDNRRKFGLILGGQPWEPQPVYAFSKEAAIKGIRPGMSLRLAHVLSPDAHFMQASPPRYLNTSGEITDILTDFTHLIEPEALWLPVMGAKRKGPVNGNYTARALPARFNIDLESLPKKEAEFLAQEIGRTVRQQTHMAPAIGLADSKFVAQIAAALTRPNHTRSINPGEENQFLTSRSIHFLPLDNETSRRLSILGIRSLGQLTAIPLASLQAQLLVNDRPGHHLSLGKDFSTLYYLAKGEVQKSAAKVIKTNNQFLAVKPLDEEIKEVMNHNFEAPITNGTTIQRVLEKMASELSGRLQAQNLESRTIQLAFEVDGKTSQESIHELKKTLRQPIANPVLMSSSFQELFQRMLSATTAKNNKHIFEHGISCISIILSDICHTSANQLSLFQPLKASSQVQTVLENIVSKHGIQWFSKAFLSNENHPLPEQRINLQKLNPA